MHPTGVNHPRQFTIFDDRSIPMLSELTGEVHAHDCPILLQLFHTGRTHSAFHSRLALWAPSAVPDPRVLEVPHEMDADDCREAYSGAALIFEPVGAIVFASPNRAHDQLYRSLKGRVSALHCAGDANAPRKSATPPPKATAPAAQCRRA